MSTMQASRWWGETTTPMKIVVLCGDGVLTVSVTVPWFLTPNAIHVLDARLQELFHAIDQMDGRADSESPVVQSRSPADFEEDRISWSREYSDPEYAAQFIEALEAMAALGIAQWVH